MNHFCGVDRTNSMCGVTRNNTFASRLLVESGAEKTIGDVLVIGDVTDMTTLEES